MKIMVINPNTSESVTEHLDPDVAALRRRGVDKFIAYEVPIGEVRRIYGTPFDVVAADLENSEDLRVLDFNGHHIFSSFSFAQLGASIKVGD